MRKAHWAGLGALVGTLGLRARLGRPAGLGLLGRRGDDHAERADQGAEAPPVCLAHAVSPSFP